MSTIPTTFNGHLPPYTVVGGAGRGASSGLSAVILNRGRYSRYEFFEELEKTRFDTVLSMESSASRYDLEELSAKFPFVRFVLMKESVTRGEEINLAAAEVSSPLFFVLGSDLRILSEGGAAGMAGDYNRLCTTPLIQDAEQEAIPALTAPALIPGKKFTMMGSNTTIRTIQLVPQREGLPSLFPFDGIGIYDRERFIRLGGFDHSIKKFYWQLMDFGFRACLWGEQIASTLSIRLSYEGELPEENSTAGDDSLKFYLKNLAPVFFGDHAHIPLSRFPAYLRTSRELSARRLSDSTFFTAWENFKSVRGWVESNRYRFVSDARTAAERFFIYAPDEAGANPEYYKEDP